DWSSDVCSSDLWAAWGAAHTAVQGVLSALYERESSGVGQHVEADLLRGAASMDIYNWFFELVCARWPDAYQAMYAFDDQGRPAAPLIYPDRKSTRLNSSHVKISYAVFCLKKQILII